jgi:hypothetical protein
MLVIVSVLYSWDFIFGSFTSSVLSS